MADLRDNLLAAILLAPAQDDGGEQLPRAVDVANLRGELHEAAFLLGILLLRQIAFADEELLRELLLVELGVGEARRRFIVAAADVMRQMEHVGEAVLDGRGRQHQPVVRGDLADAGADDGIVALDLGALVNDARGETVLA